MAFTRVGDDYIYLRTGITEPDVVVVLDPSIMRATDVTAGIKDGGKIIVNTSKSKEEIRGDFGIKHDLYTVDATKVAMEEVGRPITNTTMMGALAKVTNLVRLESLEEQIRKRFPSVADANISAMRRAYEETKI